jgi:hypothetical protein
MIQQASPASSQQSRRGAIPRWLSADPVKSPSTSNQGWDEVPFQRWYRFKEAFAPRLVVDAIESTGVAVTSCCDPFGGGGTTSLVCQYLGIEPTTIEVNPFLADLIEAKLTIYNLDELIEARAALSRALDTCPRVSTARLEGADLFPGAPATLVEPGVRGRWIFDLDVAVRIVAYLDAVEAIENGAIRRLFRVLLGSTLLGVSNVVVNGKGRRYRSASRRHRMRPIDLDEAFSHAFERALFDLCRYEGRSCQSFRILRGDSRDLASKVGRFDLALFSPPYPNSFDYTDIYNIELWALRYLSKPEDNRHLREATLRSHVQVKRDFGSGGVIDESVSLQATLDRLSEVRASLWNPHIPAMIAAYFADLKTVLQGLRTSVAADGKVMMVVGDSRYAGVMVDVPSVVSEIAPGIGFTCVDIRPVRAMRSSAQQGGDLSLAESLLILAPT